MGHPRPVEAGPRLALLVGPHLRDRVLGGRPNQLERPRNEVDVSPADLLDVAATPGEITEEGLRDDVEAGIQYLSAWLKGNGAVAIHNLMEDAATAEIARSQVWQWVRHGRFEREQALRLTREAEGDETARQIFEQVALGERFVEFLTLPAYTHLEGS